MTGDLKAPSISSFKHNIIMPLPVFSLKSWNSNIFKVGILMKMWFLWKSKVEESFQEWKGHKSQCHRLVPAPSSSFRPKTDSLHGVCVCPGHVRGEGVCCPPPSLQLLQHSGGNSGSLNVASCSYRAPCYSGTGASDNWLLHQFVLCFIMPLACACDFV